MVSRPVSDPVASILGSMILGLNAVLLGCWLSTRM